METQRYLLVLQQRPAEFSQSTADRAIVSGLEAQASGNALVSDSVTLASGNAALSIVNNPPVDQAQLIGLIMALS